jgi:Negative regulator of sigma F
MKDSGAKENVRTIVERDLRPVRPLWPPSKRALALMPLAVAIVVGVPVINYFRPDFDTLGFFRGWGLSLLESCAGLTIVALGLRESVPGRVLRIAALVAAAVVGLAIPLVVLRATADNFNLGPKSWSEWRYGMACFRTSVLAATPILAASAFLTRRAFALRPVAAGILWGLGCGLIADAGLRLYCEFTSMPHVMLEHFGAVVASMLLGAIVSSAIAPPSRPKDENRARRQT